MNFSAFLWNKSFFTFSACLFMAILLGLISASAHLILISITVALFIGSFLFARPAWIVWLILILGLLILGIAILYEAGLDPKAGWSISILGFILMGAAFFKAASSLNNRKNTPTFIWLAFVFLGYALIVSLCQWHSVEQFIGGFKRYFQMWGLLFALCWLSFDALQIYLWKRFILIVALLQWPFALYERVILVPLRESMRDLLPGMVPIDVVAGTFGASLQGGGSSGEMAIFLIIALAFLLAWKTRGSLSTRCFIILAAWILAPLFIGETKIVMIMLPLMFLVFYRLEFLARPHHGIMAVCICAMLTLAMGYAYLTITQMPLDKLFSDTMSYNLHEKGYGINYLNRTKVLTFWLDHQSSQDPISFFFGNGLGSSHQQTVGHVDALYPRYGIGLTSASSLLWDMGAFGLSLFMAIFVMAWHAANRLYLKCLELRAELLAIQAALGLFALHLFYNLTLLENIPIQIVFMAILGYLSDLYRKNMSLNQGSA